MFFLNLRKNCSQDVNSASLVEYSLTSEGSPARTAPGQPRTYSAQKISSSRQLFNNQHTDDHEAQWTNIASNASHQERFQTKKMLQKMEGEGAYSKNWKMLFKNLTVST